MSKRRSKKTTKESEKAEQEKQRLVESVAELERELDQTRSQHMKDMERHLLGIVEAVDAFDRVFANIRAKGEEVNDQMNTWVGNFRTVRRLLLRSLSDQGVCPIEDLEDGFDPEQHQAFDTKVDLTCPEGTILEEIQSGYVWQGRMLRKTQVIVARRPEDEGRRITCESSPSTDDAQAEVDESSSIEQEGVASPVQSEAERQESQKQ